MSDKPPKAFTALAFLSMAATLYLIVRLVIDHGWPVIAVLVLIAVAYKVSKIEVEE